MKGGRISNVSHRTKADRGQDIPDVVANRRKISHFQLLVASRYSCTGGEIPVGSGGAATLAESFLRSEEAALTRMTFRSSTTNPDFRAAPGYFGVVQLHGTKGTSPHLRKCRSHLPTMHPNRGEVLVDVGFQVRAAELIDIRRDEHWRHPDRSLKRFIAPGGESPNGFEVGAVGVQIADINGQEVQKSNSGVVSGSQDHSGQGWTRSVTSAFIRDKSLACPA